MKHLTPADFADAIDGRLSESGRAHVEGCLACAARVTSLRDALHEVEDAEGLPEPSPLFWEHFSSRVSAAVHDTVPDARAWWRHPAWAIACSIVLVAAAVIGVRDSRLPRPDTKVLLAPSLPVDAPVADDPAWNLLTDVAAAMEEDDPHAAPLTVRPSEVDRAVTALSGTERAELKRLLQDEMKRSGN